MILRKIFAALAVIGASGLALAQSFPAKPITVVHPFGPGSGADQNTRLIADELARVAGVPVIIDARAGGNGVIALQAVARAAPDGYTVLLTTSTTQVFNPILYKDLPLDPVSSFVPVVALTKAYQVMVVPAHSSFNSVAEFIAASKKKGMSFGSGTTAMRMGGELFKQLAGVDLLHVPYKSTPAAVTDLLAGRVDTAFVDLVIARPQIQAGKLKPLAVTSLKRLDALPNVPTLDESGLRDYENAFWSGIFAPRGTPDTVVRRLGELFAKANVSPDVERNRQAASMVQLTMQGPELAKYQQAEIARWRKVAAAAGIAPE
jgi:tripartite-type tricarboxylate transporter receptor subunit TctC